MTVSPATAGSFATYAITNLVASAAMTGGTSTVTLEAPAGTVFPNNAAYYVIADSTTPSGSGTVTAAVNGGGSDDVTITVPDGINQGPLSVSIQDVINPSGASATDAITLIGNVTGQSTPASGAFPDANLAYPNGAIVNFSGTDYVFAGGHAFAVTSSTLGALQKVDHATVVTAPAGATPPSVAPRAGTLVFTRPVNGVATIYVVGKDGELHGFATPAQFLGDGYDPALVVTVTSVSGLTVGATAGSQGSAANALATSSDGALVVSSGPITFSLEAVPLAYPTPLLSPRSRRRTKPKRCRGRSARLRRAPPSPMGCCSVPRGWSM